MNKTVLKRIGAYFIDAMVVGLILLGLNSISFLNPNNEKYEKYYDEYTEVIEKYEDADDSEKVELESEIKTLVYKIEKNSYVYLIGSVLIIVLYFGVFACITDGQTLGKKILGLQIVGTKKKKLKLHNYLIRSVFFEGVITNCITLIALLFKENIFYNMYSIGYYLNYIITIIVVFTILFKENNRGIHDMVAGTMVIDLKNMDNEKKMIDNDDKKVIMEAEIVEKDDNKSKNIKKNKS